MQKATLEPNLENPSALYAATRNALYRAGKKTEILVNYNPKLHFFGEWWKQLYGESEGKDHKGIFPAAVDNSTDLHSMGQWIQDGERTIFETVISVDSTRHSVIIPADDDNLDGLNYIAGKHVDQVNKMAELGTRIAHVDGGVPNMRITIPALEERYLGQLIYFFEKACGISGYLLGVNPFNQPGVEDYKRNMFALLENQATSRIQKPSRHAYDPPTADRPNRRIRFRIRRPDNIARCTATVARVRLHVPGRQCPSPIRHTLFRCRIPLHARSRQIPVRAGMPARDTGLQHSFGKSVAHHTAMRPGKARPHQARLSV